MWKGLRMEDLSIVHMEGITTYRMDYAQMELHAKLAHGIEQHAGGLDTERTDVKRSRFEKTLHILEDMHTCQKMG